MSTLSITVRMDERCVECGKPGATDNTLCLKCTTKAINPKAKMRSSAGRVVQERWQKSRHAARSAGGAQ